jgi:hypothetical protein
LVRATAKDAAARMRTRLLPVESIRLMQRETYWELMDEELKCAECLAWRGCSRQSRTPPPRWTAP